MVPKLAEIQKINQRIIDDIKAELRAQGHHLTGKTEDSLFPVIKLENGTVIMEGYGSSTLAVLNYGVESNRIPYNPGSGAQTSKYIDALTAYARKRFGVSGKAAKAAAFAIAQKHKKEGMPTKGSYKYSSTGQRLSAVTEALDKNKAKYDAMISDGFDLILDSVFGETFKSSGVEVI
jgi:hypothetical protein